MSTSTSSLSTFLTQISASIPSSSPSANQDDTKSATSAFSPIIPTSSKLLLLQAEIDQRSTEISRTILINRVEFNRLAAEVGGKQKELESIENRVEELRRREEQQEESSSSKDQNEVSG